MDFQYKVTVIVPVYNVEEYLRNCLDSLVAQTIDHSQMEVLLINDGSTDKSLDICYEYAQSYFMFKVFSKENEGPAAARNCGIKNAQGKYIMYLDSDDELTPETVKAVTDYFDTVYDEVDLVTYLDQPYKDGNKLKPHPRYTNLTQSGIYDIDKFPFIMQTRISVAVKNLLENNYLFDTSDEYKTSYEDQKYLNTIISKKMKIGFCGKGEYKYEKNSESLVNKFAFPLYNFENSMRYFEEMFESFVDGVPKYFQALYIHDLSWKLRTNRLFPHHYEKEKYNEAVNRIKNLLDQVDDTVILNHPSVDNFHKHFFLSMKKDKDKAVVICDKDNISVYKNSLMLYSNKKFEIVLHKLNVIDNNIKLLAFAKSPVFSYSILPEIYAVLTYQDNKIKRVKLELGESPECYYKSKEKTNLFYSFFLDVSVENLINIRIEVQAENIVYDVYYYFMPSSPFSSSGKKYKAIFDDCIITFSNNSFVIKKLIAEQILNERQKANEIYINNSDIYNIRNNADRLRKNEIWLYYDCAGVEKDNGYYQFCHDFGVNDGVTRYYVNANGEAENYSLFTSDQRSFIVNFKSNKHKALFLASKKIITAYIEEKNIVPFEKNELAYYCDISHAEIYYLQHGILHAHLPWKYAPGRIAADKIVVSSEFELKNFSRIYGFRQQDLLPVGMPRFNHINKNIKPQKRILFAPSWRNYLINEDTGNGWTTNEKFFAESDYFKIFNEFLSSERLGKFLEETDVYLDFKIHPIFKPYLHLFNVSDDHICLCNASINDEEYSLFITDFSSFVFDFAYLKRPIIYFVPDMPQFKSGMNQYWELDLPFEKAFGNLFTESETAINEIIRIVENHFVPDRIFQKRMDEFFLPLERCEDKLYKAIISKE